MVEPASVEPDVVPPKPDAPLETWEEMGRGSPLAALALALRETDPDRRFELRDAILRGWASVDANAAAAWVLALPESERAIAFEPVFTGARRTEGVAEPLVRQLCADNPKQIDEIGRAYVVVVSNAGDYGAAVNFALSTSADRRTDWIGGTMYQWAAHDGPGAIAATDAISDAPLRAAALHSLILGWSSNAPAEVANYALTLPNGPDRSEVLFQALPRWVETDPAAASEWLMRNASAGGLDAGVASVAAYSNLIDARPDVAVGWAEAIADATLRTNILRTLASQWARRDRAAVLQFLQQTPGLRAEDRAAIDEGLAPE